MMNIGVNEREWGVNEITNFMVWATEYVLVCFMRYRTMKEALALRAKPVLGGYDGRFRTPVLKEQTRPNLFSKSSPVCWY